MNIFLQYAKPLAKSTESIYNAFIRLIVNSLPEIAYATRAEAGGQALAEFPNVGNYARIELTSVNEGTIELLLDTNYFPWVSGIKLVIMSYNVVTGVRYVKVVSLSESQWVNGELSIVDSAIIGDSAVVYIVSADASKMSNISNI